MRLPERSAPNVAADATPFPEADRIVDEVLDGKRAFLFWPGTGRVVSVITLHTFAMGIWWGPTLSACVLWLEGHVNSWQPLFLVALLFSMLGLIVPVALLVRGNDYGVSALLLTTRTWFLGAAAMMSAVALAWLRVSAWPYGIACGLLALAYVLAHTESFKIYVLLRRRLRARIAERENQAATRKR